jgi:hypothetical protein
MYFIIVILTTIILPIGSAITHKFVDPLANPLFIAALWYVFWAGGVRLLLAGLRQTFQPGFTLTKIFEIDHKPSEHIVQELGFANLAISVICLVTPLKQFQFFVPAAATVAGIFYGLAGVKHVFSGHRNAQRTLAMVTDLIVFAVLATYVGTTLMDLLRN